ncbi:recombination-associated protein RdgC [Polaromonas sp.]|uniref:recombination-associated protein RdgC n=1 Tax=Polaromonas sp. TaxID=1869339 RepID=UPI002FC9056C
MFKNVMVYRIGAAWAPSVAQVEDGLAQARFVECGATQEKSVGWIAPRGEAHGALVEAVGGHWILKLMIESKAVPAGVVKRKVQERLAQIEATEGRKPGKKETREIKEDAKLVLLPMAFSKQASVTVWIAPAAQLLVIDAASQAKADEVVTCLVKSLDGMAVTPLQTTSSAAAAMSQWLTSQEPPAGFSVDRECELKASDESKAAVKYSKHPLDIDEVRQHIAAGKLPTKLAMTWNDRVSFLLTESMQLKKLAFLDVVFEGAAAQEDDGFDADAAIATGEMSRLIPELMEALGGEVVLG